MAGYPWDRSSGRGAVGATERASGRGLWGGGPRWRDPVGEKVLVVHRLTERGRGIPVVEVCSGMGWEKSKGRKPRLENLVGRVQTGVRVVCLG